MFKYTSKPQILRDMQVKQQGRRCDKELIRCYQILQRFGLTHNYMLTVIFRRHYPHIHFYSKSKIGHVPVNGYLFPAEMFDEEVI